MGYIDPQKRKRALEAKADLEQEPKRARPTLKADTQPTLDEMEVALTLSHMPVETSAMDRLIQAIQQGASPLMLSLIAKADASNIASRKLTDNDRQALLGLQALIKDILGSQDAATKENPQQVNVQNEQQQLSPQSLATGDVGDGDKIVSLVDSTQEITDVELPDAVSLASPEVADTQTEMATDTPVAVGQNGGADAADNQLSSPAEDTKPAQQEAGDAQGLAGLRSPEQAQTASEDVADITMDDVTPEKKAEPAPVVAKDTSIELAAQRAVTSSPNIKAEPEMDASVIEKAAPSSGENVPSSAVDQMDESKVNGTEKVPAIIVEPAETPSGVDKKGEMEGVS